MPSRGNCISAYSAPFAKGAKVYGAQINSGAITSAHIASGTIVPSDIAAGSVTSAKIGAGAVTSAKLGTGAVTAVKIGAGAVTSAKLGANAVTSGKMRAAFLSGTIVSGQTTRAIAHGLAVKPKSVIVVPLLTLAQAISAAVPSVTLAAASAATSTNFYVIGSQASNAALKYAAYVQL